MPVAHLLGIQDMNSLKGHEWKYCDLNPKNLVFLGIRDLDEAEKVILRDLNIKYYTPHCIDKKGGI